MGKEKDRSPSALRFRQAVNKQALAQIDALKEKRGISRNEVFRLADIAPQAWYRWLQFNPPDGSPSPDIAFLARLALSMQGHMYVWVPEAELPLPAGAPLVGPDDPALNRLVRLLSLLAPGVREEVVRAAETRIRELLGELLKETK